MKVSQRFSILALLLTSSALPLAGCYTQLASDKGDAWGYTGRPHHEVIVERQTPHSDTTIVVDKRADVASVTSPSDKVDTMYVDDARTRSDYKYPNETIINNYYSDPSSYNYYYPHPHYGVSITFGYPSYGWPDYSYYTPWYASNWYYPYDNFYHGRYRGPGFIAFDPYYDYPPSPFYNCYAPVYGPDPYWYGGYYGHGYYGYGGGYGNGFYGNGSGSTGGGVKVGRIGGGERRAGSTTTERSPVGAGAAQASGNSRGIIEVADRNAPVHSAAPGLVTGGSDASVASSQPSELGKVANTANAASSTRAVSPNANVAPNSTTAQTVMRNPQTGHRVVVIHRAAPSNGASTVATSRGVNSSGRRVYDGAQTPSQTRSTSTSTEEAKASSVSGGDSRPARSTESESVRSSSESAPRSVGRSSDDGGGRSSGGERSGGGERSSGGGERGGRGGR